MLAQLDRLAWWKTATGWEENKVSQLHTAPPSAVAAVAMPGLRKDSDGACWIGSLHSHFICLKTPEEEAPTKLPSTLATEKANAKGVETGAPSS